MNAPALTKQFARENGYTGDSPAMLKAFEGIRLSGIRAARAAHFYRKQDIDQFKAEPGLYAASIHPAQSVDEVIEDCRRFLRHYHGNMTTWMREANAGKSLRAKRSLIYARYFRRFGSRVWDRRAA